MNSIEKKQELMGALQGFLRWEKEGKPKYRMQYYYDDYHNHISRLDDGDFHFNIQMSDSPEGDTWWGGSFRLLNGGTDVEIIKDNWSRT